MSELSDLYQEMIVGHSKNPRNFGKPSHFTHSGEGYNPLCGDQIHLYLEIKEGVITSAHFEGKGCAISTASASLMTDAIRGMRLESVKSLFDGFHDLVTTGDTKIELGKLSAFGGVYEFPMRVKCATLPWHTLNSAAQGEGQSVTTE